MKTFDALRYHGMKPQLAVDERQIPEVFAVSESARFFLVIGFGVLILEQVECVEHWLRTSDQKVGELWLALRIQADDFAIENAPTPFQVATQSFTQTGETLERVS